MCKAQPRHGDSGSHCILFFAKQLFHFLRAITIALWKIYCYMAVSEHGFRNHADSLLPIQRHKLSQ